ncbi:uncharacterized protein I206_105911 [Kwoniella pini CBS 10737]|uniref:Uncharacterized protein n=1 Tax=Kwoniella pini CBS 10737 TaxID=1296096 RepID=A0A1B9I0J0_9TREE|nr:uncharacterized protein I206_04734 [Kwoniella pini CBS 10737]OCF49047.1 hypothetical protein I206_04734 [Kwoniella pini CBS 10737]
MSFIGAGELEHKVTQLQRQLDHKDHELNSIKNEQRKKDEDLTKAKRAKEDAEYKLRDEAERAHQAEKTMTTKTNEITQLKLKLSNLESSLDQANEKLKKEEKDNERISNALDEALNSGSDGASQQIKSLQSRIKQLEANLKSIEQEKEKLQSQGQGNSNDPWGSGEPLTRNERNRLMVLQNQNENLREENARLQASGASRTSSSTNDIFGAASSPSRPKTKRRSMSASGPAPSELIELENQVMTLQEQLALRKKDLDKAVNEKLALEITSKKKMQKMESDMEDVKEELDFYRRNQDSGSNLEINKLKKAMQVENDNLRAQLTEKTNEIAVKSQEIQGLEKRVELISALESDLEKERKARISLEQLPTSAGLPTESLAAEEKIRTLEAELLKVRSNSTHTSKGDVEIRQVKRELQKTLRDKEYLESLVKENDELLAEKDEEIQRMRTAIPVPGSPVLHPTGERTEELENEKMALEDQIQQQKDKYEEELKVIDSRLQDTMNRLAELTVVEQQLRAECKQAQNKVNIANIERDDINSQLQELNAEMCARKDEYEILSLQAQQLRADLGQAREMNLASRQQIDQLREQLDTTQKSLVEKEKIIDDLESQRNELAITASTRQHDDAEYAELEEKFKAAERDLIGAQADLVTMEKQKAQMEKKVEISNIQSEAAAQQMKDLTANLAAVEAQMEESEVRAKASSKEKDDTVRVLTDQLDDLKAELSALQIELDDRNTELAASRASHDEVEGRFEEAVKSLNEVQGRLGDMENAQADRSTESEAREKDEELFHLKELKDRLAQELNNAREQHEKELTATTSKQEQDLLETQTRIQELEKHVERLQSALSAAHDAKKAGAISDNEALHRMEQKISQLRSERDDLRHNLSFVQNERHFAIRAATSDKESAIEDVKRMKEALKQSNLVREKLQAELDVVNESRSAGREANDAENAEMSDRITSLESALADQADKVKSLELALQNKAGTLSSLRSQLLSSESRAEGLQKELLEMIHHVGQTAKLSEPPRPPSSFSENNDLPTDLVPTLNNGSGERTRRTSLGHMRSRSNVSVSANTLQNLNMERQLQARIGRRDARIAELTHDLEKANLNLTLAKEAQEETLEEISELVEAKDRLQRQLRQNQTVQEEDPEVLRNLVLSLVIYRQSHQSSQMRHGVAVDALSKTRIAAGKLRASITEHEYKASESAQRIHDMEQERSTLERQIKAIQEEEARSRTGLKEAQEAIEALQTRINTHEAASASANEEAQILSAIEAQVAEKEERIIALNAQNTEYTARVGVLEKELIELSRSKDEKIAELGTKVDELESVLRDVTQKVQSLEAEKAGLIEEISAAERALEEGTQESALEKDRFESTNHELTIRIQELKEQLNAKVNELTEGLEKSESLETKLRVAEARETELVASAEADKVVMDGLRQELQNLKQSAEGESQAVIILKEELITLKGSTKIAEQDKQALAREITELKDVISSKDNVQESSRKRLDETIIELQAAKEARIVVEDMISEIKGELERSEGAKRSAENSLKEAQIKLDELSAQIESTRQELAGSREQSEMAKTASDEQQVELERLVSENTELKVQLVTAQSQIAPKTDVDEGMINDLKERIEQLESSLTQKTEEVDEADDRTREAFKANAKLEKKLGKLQRQLETAQVEKNTALNKLATQPIIAPPPQPISQVNSAPTTKQRVVSAPSPANIQTQRTPLSSVNIFKPTPNSNPNSNLEENTNANAKIGHKRHREDEPIKSIGTEAILQTPDMTKPIIKTQSVSPNKTNKSSFTPQRGLHTQSQQQNLDIGKQRPAFPLPPTRSVFQPR